MSIREKLLHLADVADKPPAPDTRVFVAEATKDLLFARFFFSRASTSDWVPQAVAEIAQSSDEESAWVRLRYVLRILANDPATFTGVVTGLRQHLRGRLLFDVVHALKGQNANTAWELRFLVGDYLARPEQFFVSELGEYLAKVIDADKIDPQELCDLIASMIEFRPDPKAAEKLTGPDTPANHIDCLEPGPRFETWEYQQILEKGVQPAAARYPFFVARMLAGAVQNMLRLKVPDAKVIDGSNYDGSEAWCAQLSDFSPVHADPDELLIHTLLFSCRKAYEETDAPTADLIALDELLRREHWQILGRLRCHLYSLYPTVARAWIVETVTQYPRYDEQSYDLEFARMIRRASETFKESFLTREQREAIFKQILTAPSKERLNESWSTEAKQQNLETYQCRFWAKQYWPFEPVLFGKYLKAFQRSAPKDKPIKPEDYSAYSGSEVHTFETRSPKSAEELGALSDDALIAFLNDWQPTGRAEKEWWIETNLEGLAIAFRKLVRNSPDRFAAFGVRWREISRPIFLRYAIEAAKDEVKSGELLRLPAWLALCDWVTRQIDDRRETSYGQPKEFAFWEAGRRETVDFIAACVAKDSKVSIDYRDKLAALLTMLTTGPDQRLDQEKPLVTPQDPLTDAINTTRGRAIETLVQLGLWIRRAGGEKAEPLREAKAAYETRFAGHPPLLAPEYAQIGRLFPFFLYLDETWAAQSVGYIFARPGSADWLAAFGTFVVFSEPSRQVYGYLRPHYEYALAHAELWPPQGTRRDLLPRLGQHLFLFYLWGEDDLTNSNGLLSRFYKTTPPKVWTNLFQHTGQSLKRTKELTPELNRRCREYFAYRLAAANPDELGGATFWLEADCLDLTWRLENLIAVLALPGASNRLSTLIVRNLSQYLDDSPDLVVEALAKLTANTNLQERAFFEQKEVIAILKAGFASEKPSTLHAALEAQENLLRASQFEYLSVGPADGVMP